MYVGVGFMGGCAIVPFKVLTGAEARGGAGFLINADAIDQHVQTYE